MIYRQGTEGKKREFWGRVLTSKASRSQTPWGVLESNLVNSGLHIKNKNSHIPSNGQSSRSSLFCNFQCVIIVLHILLSLL